MTAPELVRATPADAAAIAALHTEVWGEAYRGLVPDAVLDAITVDDRRVRWEQRLAGGRRAVLARHGGAVVGAVSWVPGPPDELASLYVRRDHRGTGLAARLVDAAVGDRPAWLWVFEANPRARAFYRRVGFTVEGERATDPGTGVAELRVHRP